MPAFLATLRVVYSLRLSLYLLFVFVCCIPSVAVAQKPLRIFEKIGVTYKGRPFYASVTKDVLLDRKGRIWYSTLGSGMYRFDGYDYIHYQYDAQDSTSIDSDRVWKLVEDPTGDIWVVTYQGINRLDQKSGRFIRYGMPEERRRVNTLMPLDPTRLLVGTQSGFYELDLLTRQYTANWKPTGEINARNAKPSISNIYRDRTGQVWATSPTGLLKLSMQNKTFEIIKLCIETTGKNTGCNILMQDKKGAMWVCADTGFWRFTPATYRLEPAVLPDSMQQYIYTGIEEGPDGTFWLSGDHGLISWHPKTNRVEHFYSPGRVFDVYPNNVQDICQDKLGNLWLATTRGLRKTLIAQPNYLLYQLNIGNDSPNNHPYWAIEDQQGGILMFSGTDLFYSPKLGSEVTHIPLPPGRTLLPFANHAARSPEGNVFVSWREGGLGLWDPQKKQVASCQPDTFLHGRPIESQYYDQYSPEIVWMSTAHGLWRINRHTWQKRLCVQRNQLDNKVIHEIVEGKPGTLWCNTPSAIGYFIKKTEQFILLDKGNAVGGHIIEGEILDIVTDNDGALWVAFLGGLAKITSAPEGKFYWTILTTRNGLSSNIVNTVTKDAHGYIWVGFHDAYSARIDPQTLSRTVYDVMNPLLTRRHIRKSLYQSQTGLLFDCTQEGLVVFDPLRIRRDSTPPELVLTNIYVNNKRLSVAPEYASNLVLKPGENAIAFEFAAIHLASPYSNQYQYKLIGYNHNWVTCPADLRRAGFTNLPHGKYQFMLRAANADGIWSADKTLISFVINPPYWQTSWFRLLVILLLAAIAYAVVYNRIQQRRLREEKKLAEQNAKYKSLFLANMSHEIRTPMNAILGLSKMLEETQLADKQKTYIGAIRHSSEDLLRIVNDILDYSKIESGLYTFQFKPFDLQEVLDHLMQTFGIKAREKGITLNIEIKPGTPVVLVGDAVRLKQILGNLVGNAIKFTDSGGVRVEIESPEQSEDRAQVQFSVCDTGIGIAADKIDKVFESFNQVSVEDATAKGGTGLGLSISKQLVEQQGGHVRLESTPGVGTTVVVSLPFGLAAAADTSQATTATADLSALRHCRILLVEDIFFNQLLASELLKSRIGDVHIDIAENGQIALEKSAQSTFDLILMDVKMPVMDGLEATRRLRSLPGDNPLREIPIIGLTANAVPEELEKCRLAGMDAWVTKPIQAEELMEVIRRLLEKKSWPNEN